MSPQEARFNASFSCRWREEQIRRLCGHARDPDILGPWDCKLAVILL
jgi:hypothetical protein